MIIRFWSVALIIVVYSLCTTQAVSQPRATLEIISSEDLVYCVLANEARITTLGQCYQLQGTSSARPLTYERMRSLMYEVVDEQTARDNQFRETVSQQVNTLAARIDSVQSDILDELAKLEEREASAVGVPDLRRRVDELGQIVRELQREMATLDGETPEN